MIEYLKTTKKNFLLFIAAIERIKQLDSKINEPMYIIDKILLPNPYEELSIEEIKELSDEKKEFVDLLFLANFHLASLAFESSMEYSDERLNSDIKSINEKDSLEYVLTEFASYLGINQDQIHNITTTYNGKNRFNHLTTAKMIKMMSKSLKQNKIKSRIKNI